jgi:hypothetical protein
MFKQVLRQPNIQGIAAGAVATGQIPTSGTHYATYLRCLSAAGVALTRAQLITDIGDIRVRINGELLIEATVTFLLDLQLYYGTPHAATFPAGTIVIPWTRPFFATDAERSVFALGMADVSSFQIDVQVLGVAVLATIEVYSLVTPESRKLGQHIRINRFPQAFAAFGAAHEVVTLPKEGDTVGYHAIHIGPGTGVGSLVSLVTCKIGGNNIFENVSVATNQAVLEVNDRTPQAGYFHVDFLATSNDMLGYIPMAGVKDWRQQITWITAAPGTYNIYTERVFGLKVVNK